MGLPTVELNQQPREYVIQTVNSLAELHNLGRVKTDEETKTRINEYFKACGRLGIRPGVESLCLALGITRQTLHRWTMGQNCSSDRQEMVEQARQYINSFLEQTLLSGKGSTIGAIFAFKNWCGYRDSVTVEDGRQAGAYTGLTPDEIAKRIEQDIPLDDDTAATITDF